MANQYCCLDIRSLHNLKRHAAHLAERDGYFESK